MPSKSTRASLGAVVRRTRFGRCRLTMSSMLMPPSARRRLWLHCTRQFRTTLRTRGCESAGLYFCRSSLRQHVQVFVARGHRLQAQGGREFLMLEGAQGGRHAQRTARGKGVPDVSLDGRDGRVRATVVKRSLDGRELDLVARHPGALSEDDVDLARAESGVLDRGRDAPGRALRA